MTWIRTAVYRVGFDNQVQAIERALAAKTHDHAEMLLLAGDATHAKDLAHRDLEKCKLNYQKNQNQREKELKDREAMVKVLLHSHLHWCPIHHLCHAREAKCENFSLHYLRYS